MSWPAQPDIDTYYLHTHAYTPSPSLHQTALPVSSYSSLAGALDLPPDSRARSYSITKARPNANAGYAYPVSTHDPTKSPTRPRTRSRSNSQNVLVNSNGASNRSSGGSSSHQYQDAPIQPVNVMKPLCGIPGPTNHVIVPQRIFSEMNVYADPYFRHPPIPFQTVGIPELGVRVGKITEKYSPCVVGGNDQVFSVGNDREIRFWILWPGYSAHPVQKRMKTHSGTVTKDVVLMFIANMLLDYTYAIQRKGIPIERGYEDWTIGPRADNKQGIIGPSLFITRLHHRGGSIWQPEIWAQRRS